MQLMLIWHYKGNLLFSVDTFTIYKKNTIESPGSNSVDLIELNNLSLNSISLSLESIRSWVL